MNIKSIYINSENLIDKYESSILAEYKGPLAENYAESHQKTKALSKKLNELDEAPKSKEAWKDRTITRVKAHDFLIQVGEDLSLLIHMNRQTECMDTSELQNQLSEIVSPLANEIMTNVEEYQSILAGLKENPEIYIEVIKDLKERINNEILYNLKYFMTDADTVNWQILNLFLKDENTVFEIPLVFDECKITNPKIHQEIAFEILKHNRGPLELLLNFDKFTIDDPEARKQIALEIARDEEGAQRIDDYLPKFRLDDVSAKNEIAIEAVRHGLGANWSGDRFAKIFEVFEVSDPRVKANIIIQAIKNGWGTLECLRHFKTFGIEDPQDKKQIALAMAGGNQAEELIRSFQSLGIEDPNAEKEIVLSLAKQGRYAKYLIHYFENFEIDSPETKREIATTLAKNGMRAYFVGKLLDKFKIDDLETKKEIALLLCKNALGAADVAKYFDQFRIDDPNAKKEIAIAVFGHGSFSLAKYIEKFIGKNTKLNQEMALSLAQNDQMAPYIARHLERFDGGDPNFRKEIAFVLVNNETGAKALVENLDKFITLDPDTKIEIARIISRTPSGAIALVLRFCEFVIDKPAAKKEILFNILAHNNTRDFLCEHFDKLNLDDPSLKEEIIEFMSGSLSGATALARHFKSLKITDPSFKKKIIFAIAEYEEGAVELAKRIETFHITGPDTIREIALAIAKHPRGSQALIKYFEKFRIENEAVKNEIALAVSENFFGAKDLATQLAKFQITDQVVKEKIALNFVKHSLISELIANFKDFGIENPNSIKRMTLAILDGETVRDTVKQMKEWIPIFPEMKNRITEYLENFKHSVTLFVKNLDKVGIEDPALYEEIARRLLEWDWGPKLLAENFELERLPPEDLKHLALNFIRRDVYSKKPASLNLSEELKTCLTEYHRIRKFSLLNDEAREKILKIPLGTLQPNPADKLNLLEKIDELLKSLNLNSKQKEKVESSLKIIKNNYLADAEKPSKEELKKCCNTLYTVFRKDHKPFALEIKKIIAEEEFLEPIDFCINEILSLKDQRMRTELAHWLFYSMSLINFSRNEKAWNTSFTSHVLKMVYNVRDIDLRFSLIEMFTKQLNENPLREQQKFLKNINSPSYALLAKVLVNELKKIDPDIDVDHQFTNSLKKRKSFLRDGEKQLTLYKCLHMLTSSSLPPKQIHAILCHFSRLPDHIWIQELRALNTLLLTNNAEGIKVNPEADDQLQIIGSLRQAFLKNLPEYDLSYPDTFDNMFFGSRQPGAIGIYGLGLLRLPEIDSHFDEKPYLDTLISFIKDVDQKRFRTNRYENSSHLKTIFDSRPDLKEKWKGGAKAPLKDYSKKVDKQFEYYTLADSDDPLDLFLSGTEVGGSCQSVDQDPRLNRALMGYVMDGKYRILCIKNEKGHIKARLMLRLLWDQDLKKPVLFFERIYPQSLTTPYRKILQQFAIDRAKELGVDLISKEIESDVHYEGTPASLSSKAPAEYCDGAGGIQEGPYEIPNCFKLG